MKKIVLLIATAMVIPALSFAQEAHLQQANQQLTSQDGNQSVTNALNQQVIFSANSDAAVSSVEFRVYPNPTLGRITLRISETPVDASFYLMNANGVILESASEMACKEHTFDLTSRSSGTYIVKSVTADNTQTALVLKL